MELRNTCLAALGALFFVIACHPSETTTATTTTNATTDTGPATTPPEFPLDHYKIWRINQLPAKGTVFLKGQFDDAEWEASLTSLEFIGNPTEKTDVERNVTVKIRNDALHYLVYAIRTKEQPRREILVTNQFVKDEPWNITHPKFLLVPAAKKVIGPNDKDTPAADVPAADHFACYGTEPKRFDREILLADQFDRLKGPDDKEKIRTLEKVAFCVPVTKRVDKKTYDVRDHETHLALYLISPPEQVRIRAIAWDQFGAWKLQVTNSELLAVPSHKKYTSKTPAKTSS